MNKTLTTIALLLWACLSWPVWAQQGWSVQHFALQLEPRFESRTMVGTLDMAFSVQDTKLHHVDLDAGELVVGAVTLGAQALVFEKSGTRLHITLPDGMVAGRRQHLRISYQGRASSGLRFDADSQQVATAFSTSHWMPCLDDPSVRARFTLTLALRPQLVSVGNGNPRPPVQRPGRLTEHVWRLDTPMPSYVYGFAAGPFEQVRQTAGKTTLEYFGPQPFTPQSLNQVFADSADMLAFYEKRSGIPYPLPAYRQVLLAGPAAQEMAGYSVMGVRYGQRVLANPQAIWLGAHEMAHQWWGNGLTNRSWRHFWLNEGIATFMTAAYLEHRFGVAAYADQIEAARTKYLALKEAGLDRSLVFPDWDKPSADDRSLVYDKGALVLHELRNVLGDEKFWKGLKHYTRKHWGQSVETADFRQAMEESTGRDLSQFFAQWVEIASTRN
jgi:aminopeptidase N